MRSRAPRLLLLSAFLLVGCEKSPREAAAGFQEAIRAGDAVRACSFVAMPKGADLEGCVAMVEESEATTALFRAGLKTFGVPIGPCGTVCADPLAKADPAKAKVTVDGDRARLSWGDDTPAWSLVRKDGSWKIDWGLDSPAEAAPAAAAMKRQRSTEAAKERRRSTEAARETAREILAGKYASGDEAWAAFGNRIHTPEERAALIAAIEASGGSGVVESGAGGASAAPFADEGPFFGPVYTATPTFDGGLDASAEAGSR